mmetsp:Transcript_4221/g.8000  ORF Transcript_4221/g.8000 Transcript_4221/m.8000 type:complete len:82 (+) Transcript_4221:703-948(+)
MSVSQETAESSGRMILAVAELEVTSVKNVTENIMTNVNNSGCRPGTTLPNALPITPVRPDLVKPSAIANPPPMTKRTPHGK